MDRNSYQNIQLSPPEQTKDKIVSNKIVSYALSILGFVILVVLVYLLFIHVNKQIKNSSLGQENNTNTATIPWIMFTNSQFSYSIDYPSNWKVKNLGLKSPNVLNVIAFNPVPSAFKGNAITISVATELSQQQKGTNSLISTSRSITVDSINGSEQVLPDSSMDQTIIASFPWSNKILILEANSNYSSIFNSMLKTLKFKK